MALQKHVQLYDVDFCFFTGRFLFQINCIPPRIIAIISNKAYHVLDVCPDSRTDDLILVAIWEVSCDISSDDPFCVDSDEDSSVDEGELITDGPELSIVDGSTEEVGGVDTVSGG